MPEVLDEYEAAILLVTVYLPLNTNLYIQYINYAKTMERKEEK